MHDRVRVCTLAAQSCIRKLYYLFHLHCINNTGQLSPHELAALSFYLKCKRSIKFLQISPLLLYSVKIFAI